jgi:hypothetical protein
MAVQKKNITYKRERNKVEISGEPNDVKWAMWFDLLSNRLVWLLLLLILLCTVSKTHIVPMLWQLLKSSLPFMILLVVATGWLQIFLSG